MSVDARVNLAYAIVTTAPTTPTAGTSMVVSGFATLPAVPFNAIVHQAGATEAQIASGGEFVRVTANSSGTLTIARATEGPNAARTIVNGDIVKAGITKKTIDDILAGGPFTGMTINPTASTTNPGLLVNQSGGGTYAAGGAWDFDFNKITISGDTIDASNQAAYGLYVYHGAGGTTMTGQRVALVSNMQQTAASSVSNTIPYYSARQGMVYGIGDGGTNTGAGAWGSYFGDNIVVFSTGANCFELCGLEIDIATTSAATHKYVFGLSIEAIHVHAGVTHDAAIEMHAGSWTSGGVAYGPSSGWRYGIAFDEIESNGTAPISTDGTMIGAFLSSLTNFTVTNGIDFSKVLFSGNALALGTTTKQFTVDGNGRLGIGTAPSGGIDLKSQTQYYPQHMIWGDYNGVEAGYLVMRGSRAGGPTHASDTLGTILFQGYDTSSASQNALSLTATAGSVGAGSITGYLSMSAGDLILTSGSLGATGTRVVKGWFTDLEVTNAPTLNGVAIPSISSTHTLTNKRITKRTGTTTSSATPTINTDNVDFYSLTAQTVDITSFTTNISGTPTEGQTLWIAITGTAARAITWGTSFETGAATLPTTTVTTNRLDVGFIWNTVSSKWRCVASG